MAEAPNGFEDFEGCCERLRDVLKEKAEYNCAIMVETKGPTLHLGKVQNDRVELLQGQMLELTTDELVLGTNEIVSCDYPQLADNKRYRANEVKESDPGEASAPLLPAAREQMKRWLKCDKCSRWRLVDRRSFAAVDPAKFSEDARDNARRPPSYLISSLFRRD